MAAFREFLRRDGFFLLLLLSSGGGHVALPWLAGSGETLPQLHQPQRGHTSISVHMVALAAPAVDRFQTPVPERVPLDDVPPPRTAVPEPLAIVAVERAIQPAAPPVPEASPVEPDVPRTERTLERPERERREASAVPPQTAADSQPLARCDRRPAPDLPAGDVTVPQTLLSEQSSGTDSAPAFASRPLPEYPPQLLLNRIEGTVNLLVTVGRDGRVLDAKLQASSGHPEMDRSALDAIRGWTFVPARRGNTPIVKRVVVPIEFRIRE